ncbi:MAG: F0F1 ATP synthase subunit delta [Synergistaceae bacterium]|jgi:F-type H+-transporting ATPase subunit delta|nr:F0F1 ATP synthase subunit delta [Synergistaceae bacterium]
MINLNSFYARGLVEYAESLGMLPVLHEEASGILDGHAAAETNRATDALIRFMRAVPRRDRRSVLKKFAALARDRLGMIDVDVTAPRPLSPEQLSALSDGIRRSLKKNPVVSVRLDESLLGGVRVIAGNLMADYSIKQKISRLRRALREKVVSENEQRPA